MQSAECNLFQKQNPFILLVWEEKIIEKKLHALKQDKGSGAWAMGKTSLKWEQR